MSRIYNALVLNDYAEAPYAQWVKEGKKTIETRMNREFSYRGDLVICCGKTNSVGQNAGKALCIVDLYEVRPMLKEDEAEACIEWDINRKALLLRNWRYFSRDFEFSPVAIKKNFQGIFSIALPDDILIIQKSKTTNTMFEIKVTLTATPELLAVLTAIAGLGTTKPIASKPGDGGSAAASKEEGKKIVDSAKPVEPKTGETEKEIPIEDVRKAVFKKSEEGKKEQAKKACTDFGFARITDIPAEKRAEFIQIVEKL